LTKQFNVAKKLENLSAGMGDVGFVEVLGGKFGELRKKEKHGKPGLKFSPRGPFNPYVTVPSVVPLSSSRMALGK
jgi:hypothetical protein